MKQIKFVFIVLLGILALVEFASAQSRRVVIYDNYNFRGRTYNVSSNITFAPGDEWYNRIRSIKVYKGKPPIQPR